MVSYSLASDGYLTISFKYNNLFSKQVGWKVKPMQRDIFLITAVVLALIGMMHWEGFSGAAVAVKEGTTALSSIIAIVIGIVALGFIMLVVGKYNR
jgi:hypothetical protein